MSIHHRLSGSSHTPIITGSTARPLWEHRHLLPPPSPRQPHPGPLWGVPSQCFMEALRSGPREPTGGPLESLPAAPPSAYRRPRGPRRPEQRWPGTLVSLSFTPATSILVLRGTLVLVRRILSRGTLQRTGRYQTQRENSSEGDQLRETSSEGDQTERDKTQRETKHRERPAQRGTSSERPA